MLFTIWPSIYLDFIITNEINQSQAYQIILKAWYFYDILENTYNINVNYEKKFLKSLIDKENIAKHQSELC